MRIKWLQQQAAVSERIESQTGLDTVLLAMLKQLSASQVLGFLTPKTLVTWQDKTNIPQFPYALSALPTTLEQEWSSPSFARYRDAFPPEHAGSPAALEAHVRDLMSRDVKIAYLKSLQGYLWENGYASGALKAPLFPDVVPRIRQWAATRSTSTSEGAGDDAGSEEKGSVMIYSSGSVPAQKLLFKYTNTADEPDLTGYLADYFDTVNAGPKQEAASYTRIAAAHPEVPVGRWLFLSDNVREVEAALEAGMQSYVVVRPGNAPLTPEEEARHRVVRSFEEISFA